MNCSNSLFIATYLLLSRDVKLGHRSRFESTVTGWLLVASTTEIDIELFYVSGLALAVSVFLSKLVAKATVLV